MPQKTTVDHSGAGTESNDLTTGFTLVSTGQGIRPGDYAAIGLGVLILIAIVLVVAGVIVYKKGLCGIGPRKKGMLREFFVIRQASVCLYIIIAVCVCWGGGVGLSFVCVGAAWYSGCGSGLPIQGL